MNLSARQSGTLEMSTAMLLSGFIGFLVIESEQSVWNVIFFRCLFGAVGLALYCWWRGFLSPWPLRGKTLITALFAAIALVLNWVLLFNAYSYASISLSTVVYNTQPFFLLLAGSLVLGERIAIGKLPWFVSAFIGLLLIIELNMDDLRGDQQLLGFAMALGAAILYAVNTLLTKRLGKVRPEVISLLNTLVGMVILLPLANFSVLPEHALQWSYLLILGLVHTCVMYILLYSSYQKLPIAMIAILAFLYPAVAIVVDYFVYQQSLSIYQWLGVIVILFSVTGLNLGWSLKSFKFNNPANTP
ncbi:MAG: DMT family transporter [Oceanospirillaceae bacterium]|nr:DMT family transporter [Oceanospirillaceae bacterium]